MAKVKYPVKAALARFRPIRDHLATMEHYLMQAGRDDLFRQKIQNIRIDLIGLEDEVEHYKERDGRRR